MLSETEVRNLYVAGHPRKLAATLEPAGANRFIYSGCNVLDALTDALAVVGVG